MHNAQMKNRWIKEPKITPIGAKRLKYRILCSNHEELLSCSKLRYLTNLTRYIKVRVKAIGKRVIFI